MRLEPGPGGEGSVLAVKVVPGASRSAIAGPHGEGLRVRVAAPPERGRANAALVELLAESLGVRRQDVHVLSGHGSARKIVHLATLAPAEAARRLAAHAG
jgi:hypothetical protein